ncbi:MAG: hypothetical protein WAQ98_07040 [Blastocatellia bacterium]
MKDYQNLLNKFYSLTFSLQLRSIFIKIVAFALFIATFLINMSWFDSTETNFFSRAVGTIASTLAIPALFMIIASPLTSMTIASLYLKSRQAKNNNYGHTGSSEEAILSERMKFTPFRKVLTAGALALSILASSFSYVAMVPPTATATIVRPAIEKVADSENAWGEYNLAIQDMLDFPLAASKVPDKSVQELMSNLTIQQMKEPGFSNLEKVALGEEEFNEAQLAYLDKHQGAIKHLIAGAKLSKSQFYSELPTFVSPVPSLLQVRGLTLLAAAETRRLLDQGKAQEAVELALANYEMATDIGAESNSTLISSLISVVCRGIAAKSLFTVIYSGKTTAEMDKEIARRVDEQDRRMPNAYQSMLWETQAMNISMEEILVKNNVLKFASEDSYLYGSGAEQLFKVFPGLRIRTFNSLYTLNQEHVSKVRKDLENWDFVSSREVYKNLSNIDYKDILRLSPSDMIARSMFYVSMPNFAATMRSLYFGGSFGETVTIFAATSAYKKEHGQFPNTLDLALKNTGLASQIDVATGKQIGYRLENGNPIVWFAGVDGQDDNGQVAYPAIERDQAIAGKDLVYSYGKLPLSK